MEVLTKNKTKLVNYLHDILVPKLPGQLFPVLLLHEHHQMDESSDHLIHTTSILRHKFLHDPRININQ